MMPFHGKLTFLFFGLLFMVARLVVCDADFVSVRTTMNADYSGKKGDPAAKYFRKLAHQTCCLAVIAIQRPKTVYRCGVLTEKSDESTYVFRPWSTLILIKCLFDAERFPDSTLIMTGGTWHSWSIIG